ncbi:hypothetical protein BMS3Abin14_01352 [bacterium BMS3Abin14]|nr:hypothetical protein BMS3Abin14_01352 [bacterium BMS3Abin14]
MNGRISSESGLTLIELMLVVAIIGILTAVGVYNFLAELPAYRLRGATNKIAASLQLVKMRAIAKNRSAWLVVNTSNNFFTGFVDEDADSAIDAPGEYTEAGMDMPDTFGGTPGFLLPDGVSFGWPSSYGGSGPDGVTPGGDTDGVFVAGVGMSGKNNIGFRPTGLPVVDLASIRSPTNSVIIFLKNTRDQGFAISIGITGRVKTYQWSGGSWQ